MARATSLKLHKRDFWKHERKWRMVGLANIETVFFPPQVLKSIISGAGEDEATLRAIAVEREVPVVFKRARLDERTYRVDITDA